MRHCSAVLGLAVCSLMLLSLVGYMFGAREFYAIPWLSAIALQTASMFMGVGIALIASVPDQQPMRLLLSDSMAGIMARRALPVVILVPPLFGWLRNLGGEMEMYDEGTGRTLLIVSIILVTVTVLWHTLRVVARQEEASNAANRYIEDTLESIADGFIRIDPEWRFTYVNREAERLLMERRLLLGKAWHDVFAAAVGTEMEFAMQRAMNTRVPIEIEHFYEPWQRWFLVKLHPMEDGGLSSVFTDITSQKSLQDTIRNNEIYLAEELARRTDQVVRAERALARNERMAAVGTLASGLAHDINNITMPLGLRMERLLKNPSVSRELKGELSAVTALLDHLRSMSKNLSLFSRDPEQEGTVGSTDLSTWWASVEMLLASSLFGSKRTAANQIKLRGEIPRGLPAVNVAPHRLTQAVINLVHNGRDAIMARGLDCNTNGDGDGLQGTITIRARTHAQGPDSSVAVSVIDDGCGMSPEVMTRALEPFFTTKDRSEAVSSGSGLGLSLVQAICERSGGSLEIESEVGTGTTVTMVLPIAGQPQEAAPEPARVL
jgi:signal transduction histidine kinase